MKGEKIFDKMSAHCVALSVEAGDKKYIDGACVLADSDGDKIFSTFDTRDVDRAQPDRSCGTLSSRAAPARTRASSEKSRSLVWPCPPWLVPAAISRWTFRTTHTWEIK
jgi:hypothetical protein